MVKLVLTSLEEICTECFEGAAQELVTVLEHDVITPRKRQVLLHSLTDDADFSGWIFAKSPDDQMTVVASEVVEENWDFVALPVLKVAAIVSCATIATSEVVVVPHLVCFGHWLVA